MGNWLVTHMVTADVVITEFNCTNNFSSPPSLLIDRAPRKRTYCNSVKQDALITSHNTAYRFVSSQHSLTFFENLMSEVHMQILEELQ
jgi:hypothetical protein